MPIQCRKSDRFDALNINDTRRTAAQQFARTADWRRSLPGSVWVVREWDDTWDALQVIEARPDGVLVVLYKDGSRMTCGRAALEEVGWVHWPNNTSWSGSLFGTPDGTHVNLDDIAIIDGKPHQAVYEEYLVW